MSAASETHAIEKKPLLRSMKKELVIILITTVLSSIGTALFVLVPFYFNTNNNSHNTSVKLTEIQEDIDVIKESISNLKIEPAITKEKVLNIEKEIDDLKNTVSDGNKKIDKIYEIILYKSK